MVRLLMVLLVVMVEREKRPEKRQWWRLRVRQAKAQVAPAIGTAIHAALEAAASTNLRTDQDRLTTARRTTPEPATLVGKEHMSAVKLQMPMIPGQGDFEHIGWVPDRFDTPIARALTEEIIRVKPRRCPDAAIRHLPIDAPIREQLHRMGPEAPKGRPTRKRPRKVHK